ncbi:MBL fold metallo-hydrolase [Aureimonas pseudogalii]|uniref:Glyoxylase-like metal-dependent hydrolase (Beta-lactamase superfamily II) n=1 Tax=Aureimonas pseudogalii TaxID=1744844 RepID=A0A7W6MK48_9HYPH|nr:MBL fold metallo-hydrolase [Aureimonas pseudogalii]MBB3998802.1 glyoxylase-like metal-dependent hydrolase (beta-lactamase superfamily II) [Aureimonas pseudogalii]
MTLSLDMDFHPEHGRPTEVAPGVRRITAPNAGPMTFQGTNTYLVGSDAFVVVDPGPADERHLAALLQAIGDRPVEAILVTHTHVDHSALARRLADETGAPLVAEGLHRLSRALLDGEVNPLDAAGDWAFRPDLILADGATLTTQAGRFTGVATPGHAANHMAFALEDTGLVFSGDHVMAWSTSVVAPPDGRMSDFMRSLDRLLERDDRQYLPGHGGPVERPQAFVRALKTHRRMREAAILERVRGGDRTIAQIVRQIYRGTDPKLHGAAALSVLAHLEDLVEKGVVVAETAVSLTAEYRPA